uniref:Uncharacterized protein n=1 Tax=Kalanchoe fedtschenkoi TaxID=63787 RepID=A0A7N1A8T3_KALFE
MIINYNTNIDSLSRQMPLLLTIVVSIYIVPKDKPTPVYLATEPGHMDCK